MQIKCPWCGLVILVDGAEFATHHEAPPCADYVREVTAAGGKATGALLVDEDALGAIPKLRRRSKLN